MRALIPIVLFLSGPAFASLDCQEPGTTVIYGNGMFNSYAAAMATRVELEREMGPQLEARYPEETFRFELSYQADEFVTTQLEEVTNQWIGGSYANLLRWLAGGPAGPSLDSEKLADTVEVIFNAADEDFSSHIDRYDTLLREGNKVLLVAHSQGTLYANAAHAAIGNEDSFKLVFAGSPAHYVNGGGSWVENERDPVGWLGSLPATADNIDKSADISQHAFVESYLRGDVAGPQLQNAILTTAGALEKPEAELQKGIITVSLTWGAQPDVDLHVFEADGGHVYYSNPSNLGALDRDDTNGYGPEHYFLDCEALEAGSWDIGVNYYSGQGPELASVLVQAGSIVESFDVPLNTPLGPDGDAMPIGVASVETTFEDGAWTFAVTGH